MSVLISCEMGGDAAPAQLILSKNTKKARRGSRSGSLKSSGKKTASGRVLSATSHDAAAQYVAKRMARRLGAPLVANKYSPALIDVTRSLQHRNLFSSTTRNWPPEQRQRLIDTIYIPHWEKIRAAIKRELSRASYVIHLSVQSFPLGSARNRRRADMGLLYDPVRDDEVDVCLDWIDEMYDEVPMLRVRRNYPQRGIRDSMTKALRNEFADRDYIGIKMMLNRAWVGRPLAIRDEVIDGICWSLRSVLELPKSKAA